jgi:hypothetical protein
MPKTPGFEKTSRRDFLRVTAGLAAAGALLELTGCAPSASGPADVPRVPGASAPSDSGSGEKDRTSAEDKAFEFVDTGNLPSRHECATMSDSQIADALSLKVSDIKKHGGSADTVAREFTQSFNLLITLGMTPEQMKDITNNLTVDEMMAKVNEIAEKYRVIYNATNFKPGSEFKKLAVTQQFDLWLYASYNTYPNGTVPYLQNRTVENAEFTDGSLDSGTFSLQFDWTTQDNSSDPKSYINSSLVNKELRDKAANASAGNVHFNMTFTTRDGRLVVAQQSTN